MRAVSQDFVFCAQPQPAPSPGVQATLMDAFRSRPSQAVWQSKDIAVAAGVRRGSARSALQELIRKMLVTYAHENGECVGFRLVVERDWQ